MTADTIASALEGFPVQVSIPVAWGDMDAFQHVNNTVYLRWFETVRIELFQRVGWMEAMDAGEAGPILARASCVFQSAVTHPDTVVVGAAVSDLGSDRFTVSYRVYSQAQGRVVAVGDSRIVSFDYRSQQKAPTPAAVQAALEALR